MGIRTGQQYIDDLNKMKVHVSIDGEVVTENVAEHPAFENVVQTYAKLFDLQHDPKYQEALTYTSPTTGDLVNASYLVPKNEEDLKKRREAISTWARYSNGFLGRSGDYMNSSLTALSMAKEFFGTADPVFAERVEKYYEWMRENDKLATHTLIPPQSNRSQSAAQQMGGNLAAKITERREDGIVINGARMLATIAPFADEMLVFPSTVLKGNPEDEPYSYAFAIPSDTPGLKYICRQSLYRGGSFFDEPLAKRYEEMDSFVVFDNVFVPNERIFLLGHPDKCNDFYAATGAGQLMTHQVVNRTIAKTEFILGLATVLAESIGIDKFQHIQEDLGEIISVLGLTKAVMRACEADGEVNKDGVYLPKWEYLNACRNWYPKMSQRWPEILRKFSASGTMALPTEADLSNEDTLGDINAYFQSKELTGPERVRLFRLVNDACISAFSSRQALYEYYFFGDPVRMKQALVAATDLEPYRERVNELLNREGF